MYQGSLLVGIAGQQRLESGEWIELGLRAQGPQAHDALGRVVEDRQVARGIVLAAEVDEAAIGPLMAAKERDRALLPRQLPAHGPGQHGRVGHSGQVTEVRVRIAGVSRDRARGRSRHRPGRSER